MLNICLSSGRFRFFIVVRNRFTRFLGHIVEKNRTIGTSFQPGTIQEEIWTQFLRLKNLFLAVKTLTIVQLSWLQVHPLS